MKRLTLVAGGILVASALGVAGVLRVVPLLPVLAAVIMFLESIPLIFSFAPLTLMASGLFLLAAKETGELGATARIIARVLGTLAGLFALNYLISAFLTRGGSMPPLLLVLILLLVLVAFIAWWPAGRRVNN